MPRKRPFEYKIEDILSEYNEDLYNEVSLMIDLVLEKNMRTGWSAKIRDGRAIITYNKADSPDACFAHELLHIKYELMGLVIPYVKDNEGIHDIMPFIFNQLCHHKFYADFYEMGFSEDEFLNDKDKDEVISLISRDFGLLKDIYEKNGIIPNSVALLLPYIVLKSPHDQSESTQHYISELKSYGSVDFFNEVDEILEEWRVSDTLDSSLTFAKLFKVCNMPKVGFCLSGMDDDIIIAGNI